MIFIPYDKMQLSTKKSQEEVNNVLNIYTETTDNNMFSLKRKHISRGKYFFGIIEGNKFLLTRHTKFRNSFLPIIKGNIEGSVSDTKVNVITHISYIAAIVIGALILIALGMALSIILKDGISQDTSSEIISWLGLIAVSYAFIIYTYRSESKLTIKIIEAILEDKA